MDEWQGGEYWELKVYMGMDKGEVKPLLWMHEEALQNPLAYTMIISKGVFIYLHPKCCPV